jgi:peptidoglycan hydrolase CwlO-like protein
LARRATVRRSARFVGLFAGVSAILLALAVPLGLASGSPAAVAAPAPDASGAQARVDAARHDTEAVTRGYFEQLDRYEVVGSEIAATEQRMADIRRQSTGLRVIVARRALRAYKSGGAGSVDFMLDGTGIEDVARGTKLLSVANAHDDDAVAQLRSLTDDLAGRRAELEASRQEQSAALEQLRGAQRKVDGNLRAALADQQSVVARLAAQDAADRAAKQAAVAAAHPQSSSTTGRVAAASTPSAPAPTPEPVTPVVGSTPTSGSHPHHDDPFLTCTRERESHGQYSAVNPSGPYLGAYQFLQSTWNITAEHAGRADLVGVPPNAASAYDQDDMAWTLYQWQGTGPWGGAC